MIKVAKLLSEEVRRLARRETKIALARLKKPSARLKKTVAELKARLLLLEKELARAAAERSSVPSGESGPEQPARVRITAKGMRGLRRKLRLTKSEFAALLKVSPQMVHLWETKQGALKVRNTTRAAILRVREFGAREARKQLQESAPAKKPRGVAPRSRRARRKR